jgi:acetyl esterase
MILIVRERNPLYYDTHRRAKPTRKFDGAEISRRIGPPVMNGRIAMKTGISAAACAVTCAVLYAAAWGADISLRLAAEPRSVVYKEISDRQLHLHYFQPMVKKTGKPTAALVCIHGGGWLGGDPTLMFPHIRYFAARGIATFSVQYRLTSEKGVTVADCIEDCKSAVRWIRANYERFNIDPNRIAVMGDSAGGHLAACMGVMDEFDAPGEDKSIPSLANAMILYNPVVDAAIPQLVKLVPDLPIPGAQGLSREEIARRISPLFRVRPGQPPAIVLHGLDDTNVPPDQARQFADAMKAAGNRCDLVLYPGTPHAFVIVNYTSRDEVVVRAIRRADEFLRSLGYVKGRPTLTVQK